MFLDDIIFVHMINLKQTKKEKKENLYRAGMVLVTLTL
jgi:hypothetical protein